MKFPPVVLIGIDPAASGPTGVAVLGLGDPILESIVGIENAKGCAALLETSLRLVQLEEPVHIAVGIEYPRWHGKGGGAATVRAAANAWGRILAAHFKSHDGVSAVHTFQIDPSTWQRDLLGDLWKAVGTKKASLMRVNQLLGMSTFDHNVSDAVCIAEYVEGLWQQKRIAWARDKRHTKRRHHQNSSRRGAGARAKARNARHDADTDFE